MLCLHGIVLLLRITWERYCRWNYTFHGKTHRLDDWILYTVRSKDWSVNCGVKNETYLSLWIIGRKKKFILKDETHLFLCVCTIRICIYVKTSIRIHHIWCESVLMHRLIRNATIMLLPMNCTWTLFYRIWQFHCWSTKASVWILLFLYDFRVRLSIRREQQSTRKHNILSILKSSFYSICNPMLYDQVKLRIGFCFPSVPKL